GLAQMVALRYGTIPIVRKTGGLNDTITDSGDGMGNGYTFSSYNAHDMQNAVWRAFDGCSDKKGLETLRKRAMECNNSWAASAKAYIGLYKELCEK
ncbi:MAG: starch synthase, partial [Clostridia bacterium]|nr:starch synthase [Clostridia bacterium]